MPGIRTFYRQIQVVLDHAKEREDGDDQPLAKRIHSNRPRSFRYSWRNPKSDKLEPRYSENSINRVIDSCVELRLLGKNEKLTQQGVSATDPDRFPSILGRRVVALLEARGVALSSIVNAATRTLSAKPPRLPTGDEVWHAIGEPVEAIDVVEFKRYLTLLGQCGVVQMLQKRIFLPA